MYLKKLRVSLRIIIEIMLETYASSLKQLGGHIGLGPSVCPSVHLSVTRFVCLRTSEPLELGA